MTYDPLFLYTAIRKDDLSFWITLTGNPLERIINVLYGTAHVSPERL
jgi:hypothetical protein